MKLVRVNWWDARSVDGWCKLTDFEEALSLIETTISSPMVSNCSMYFLDFKTLSNIVFKFLSIFNLSNKESSQLVPHCKLISNIFMSISASISTRF